MTEHTHTPEPRPLILVDEYAALVADADAEVRQGHEGRDGMVVGRQGSGRGVGLRTVIEDEAGEVVADGLAALTPEQRAQFAALVGLRQTFRAGDPETAALARTIMKRP